MSARYRCKSYRTYGCNATLEINAIGNKERYTEDGYHSEECIAMNGIKPKNFIEDTVKKEKGVKNISMMFKKRCLELALQKKTDGYENIGGSQGRNGF